MRKELKASSLRQAPEAALAARKLKQIGKFEYFCIMYLKEKDIQIIRDYFAGKPVLKAYLFGSYSRNEADDDSDIDILVDLDYSQHIGLGFVQMKLDLEQRLHKSIDLVSTQAITKRLLPYINKDKKLIYESSIKKSSFHA